MAVNYTEIELEFNKRIQPEITRITQDASFCDNPQMVQNKIKELTQTTLFSMRRERTTPCMNNFATPMNKSNSA